MTVLQELEVKNVIVGKQFENSENLQNFTKIIKDKKIKFNIVESGDRINIEKNLYFDVLWPDSQNEIAENSINNSSVVCKLNYKKFSMLFTGDIEKVTEEVICKMYRERLKSTVLKVAHHGSKTSTTKEFIDIVNPKIALIGVGASNKFGHPNDEVLDRLQELRSNSV